MVLEVTYEDSEGEIRRIYPTKISAKVTDNSATEITMTFNNKNNQSRDVLITGDIIRIEEIP